MKITNQEQFKKDLNNVCYYLEIDGECLYLEGTDHKLQLGGVTNAGFYPTYEIEIDYDFSFDENLQALIESYQETKN